MHIVCKTLKHMLFTLVELFSNSNSFSHMSQTYFDHNEVRTTFNSPHNDVEKITHYNNFYNVFYYRGRDPVNLKDSNNTAKNVKKQFSEYLFANIHIIHNVYYKDYVGYDVLELYSIYVSPKHRKMGFAKSLILDSIKRMIDHYELITPILALHLNPRDKMMNVSFSFYVNLGFHHVAFVNGGPEDLKYNLNNVDIKWNEVHNKTPTGRYLAMFCFDGINNSVNGDFRNIGENIRSMLIKYAEDNDINKDSAHFDN